MHADSGKTLPTGILALMLIARSVSAQTVADLLARVPDIPRPAGPQCIRAETVPVIDEAVEALAARGGSDADAALTGLTSRERHDAIRRSAVRALARTRGATSLGLLRGLIDGEPRASLFTQDVVLAIARVPGDEALAALMELVREHPDPKVNYLALVGLTKRSEPAASEELRRVARQASNLGRQANLLLMRQKRAQQ